MIARPQLVPAGFTEYAAIDAVNWTLLRELRKSPKHFQHRTQTPREDADVLRLGRASHTAVFEPDRFLLDYVVWTGERRAGNAWKGFQEVHADRTILTRAQYDKACRIRDAVRAHPVAARYLAKGQAEQAIVWTDAKTGRVLKGRLDWVTGESIVDLKTSKSIDSRPFATSVASYGYASQLAFYRRGWEAVTGKAQRCVLLAVESEPPHDVAVYPLSEDALQHGDEEVAELLELLVKCEGANDWPGRYPEEIVLNLPAWCYPDDESVGDSAGVKWLMAEGDES